MQSTYQRIYRNVHWVVFCAGGAQPTQGQILKVEIMEDTEEMEIIGDY